MVMMALSSPLVPTLPSRVTSWTGIRGWFKTLKVDLTSSACFHSPELPLIVARFNLVLWPCAFLGLLCISIGRMHLSDSDLHYE